MPVLKKYFGKNSVQNIFLCKNKERQLCKLVKILCALGEIALSCMEKL